MVTFENNRWEFTDYDSDPKYGRNIKLEQIDCSESYRAHVIGGNFPWSVAEVGQGITELLVYYSDNNDYYANPVYIPHTVKKISIISDFGRIGYNRVKFHYINKNLGFFVDERNDVYYSDKFGSLYQNNKTELVHFCLGTDDNVNDGVLLGIKTIKQGAISLGCKELTLPESFVSLKRETISGSFQNIIFKGKLQEIEKGALDKVYNRDGDCTLKINGLLSDINNEGKEELRKWYNLFIHRHRVVFATPQPNGRILENGFIELSEVLSMSEKINNGLDTRPISINADINLGIVRRGDEEQDVSNVPIIIKEVSTGEASYKSMPITQISFATNKEILLYVYERYEDVKRMIQQSYKGKDN